MSSRAPAPDLRDRVARLSGREREVLRLLLRGHDGKSAARLLGISPGGVHERLREARRKLEVTSSREAARLLAAVEGDPEFSVDEDFGLGPAREPPSSEATGQRRLGLFMLGGLLMLAVIAGSIGLWATSSGSGYAPPPQPGVGAPRVVRTSPRQGAQIGPGPFALSVTYDQPMQAGNYSFVRVSRDSFPDCDPRASQSADRRTYTMHCIARAGARYEVWFNSPPYLNFRSAKGVSADPYQLLFGVRGR
jgi:DNA-binding CsgD family transcriptional regulator